MGEYATVPSIFFKSCSSGRGPFVIHTKERKREQDEKITLGVCVNVGKKWNMRKKERKRRRENERERGRKNECGFCHVSLALFDTVYLKHTTPQRALKIGENCGRVSSKEGA